MQLGDSSILDFRFNPAIQNLKFKIRKPISGSHCGGRVSRHKPSGVGVCTKNNPKSKI
jgi:hypothetical protein